MFKILSLMLLAVPTLTACGTNYDVTMILEKSDSYVYDNGKQEIVFNIKSKDASEYGVGFASTLDSSCIQSSDYVAGKTLSFDRLSDTSVKVSFDGDSTYSFGDDFQVEFTFKFLDKAFNKEGFHDYGNSLYLTRSHAQIDSVISGSSPKGAFGFKLYGTTLKGEDVEIDNLVCTGVTVTGLTIYNTGSVLVKYDDKTDNATVKFPAALFNNEKDLVFSVNQLVTLSRVAFSD